MQITKITMQHTNGGWYKNHLHLISGMLLNRNQRLLMRMTMYLFYTFTEIDKCTH